MTIKKIDFILMHIQIYWFSTISWDEIFVINILVRKH